MAEYDSMTDLQLERENQKLQKAVDEIRDEKQKIADVLNERADERTAEAALAGLSPGAKDVLIKAVAATAKTKPGSNS